MGAAAVAVWSRAGGAARVGWRVLRWPLVVTTLLGAAAIQAVVLLMLLWPLDPAALRRDRDGAHWVRLEDVPALAVAALVESEDHGFYDHRGVEGRGLVRAAWLDARAGRIAYGGSTLSMQLARLLYTHDQPRGLGRKLREVVHAVRLERALTKREILEQWLNRADYGHGAHGIDAAARTYFGRPVSSLTTDQAVLLICLPRAPRAYDPFLHPGAAAARRDRVLELLRRRGLAEAGPPGPGEGTGSGGPSTP